MYEPAPFEESVDPVDADSVSDVDIVLSEEAPEVPENAVNAEEECEAPNVTERS